MMTNLNLTGLYIGMAIGACFLLFSLLKFKKPPEFLEIAVIILSCTGVVIGAHLGYLACSVTDQDLGCLVEHRIPIVLGALAVIWTSIDSIVNTFKQSIEKIKD